MAEAEVFDLLYTDLRRIASRLRRKELRGCTLRPTELVHEAYLRLGQGPRPSAKSRLHFLAIASNVIRRVLVDRARQRLTRKRGGDERQASPPPVEGSAVHPDVALLELSHELDRVRAVDPLAVKIVELRYIAGLTVEETATTLGIGPATVVRRWRWIRACLRAALACSADEPEA